MYTVVEYTQYNSMGGVRRASVSDADWAAWYHKNHAQDELEAKVRSPYEKMTTQNKHRAFRTLGRRASCSEAEWAAWWVQELEEKLRAADEKMITHNTAQNEILCRLRRTVSEKDQEIEKYKKTVAKMRVDHVSLWTARRRAEEDAAKQKAEVEVVQQNAEKLKAKLRKGRSVWEDAGCTGTPDFRPAYLQSLTLE